MNVVCKIVLIIFNNFHFVIMNFYAIKIEKISVKINVI